MFYVLFKAEGALFNGKLFKFDEQYRPYLNGVIPTRGEEFVWIDRMIHNAQNSVRVSVHLGRVQTPLENRDNLGRSLIVQFDRPRVQTHGYHIHERVVTQAQVLHCLVGIGSLKQHSYFRTRSVLNGQFFANTL